MKMFRALCVKDYEYNGAILWRNNKLYDVLAYDEEHRVYRMENEYNESLCEENVFKKHFQKVPNNVLIQFRADFSTDGDFHFDEENLKELEPSPLYDGASIKYHYNKDWENISFELRAKGKSNACRYALRDLLEEMIASFRTYSGKYYLVKKVYDLLEGFHDVIWNNNDVEHEDYLSGNYDGTSAYLRITEIPDTEDVEEDVVAEPESNWIEVVIDGDAKLKCPHCDSVHPDVPYVRGFKHCPSCGEVL